MKKYSEAAIATDIIKDGVCKGMMKYTGISVILGIVGTAAFCTIAYAVQQYQSNESESEFDKGL